MVPKRYRQITQKSWNTWCTSQKRGADHHKRWGQWKRRR